MWSLLLVSAASADECACLGWEDTWAWDDCATGEDCSCQCGDPAHGTSTEFTSAGQVCSAEGLLSEPRDGASCVLVDAVCTASDCCDDANADCPGESGCGCDAGGSGLLGLAALLPAVALAGARRRRACCDLEG